MKTINCKRCNCTVAHIENGSKLKPKIVILCAKCYEYLEMIDLASKLDKKSDYDSNPLDIFNSIFNKGK